MGARDDQRYSAWRTRRIEAGQPIGWVVDSCTCGAGGGDRLENFDTEAAALEEIEYIHNGDSDASLIALWAPDGTKLTTEGFMGFGSLKAAT